MQQLVEQFGNISSEILSGSKGVYFSEVLQLTDVQKYTNQNTGLNLNPGLEL
jgi:hypothetical protein